MNTPSEWVRPILELSVGFPALLPASMPLFTRYALGVPALLLALVTVMLTRTLCVRSRQLPVVTPAPAVPVDLAAAVERLAGALRCPTVSQADYAATDFTPFAALHAQLRQSFPRVFRQLHVQTINDYGLLLEWPGREVSLKPLLLLAHQDVVPVESGTEENWIRPPFAGLVCDGFLYGRGALDDKLNLVGQLEAVEHLLATGYQPRRTVLLAFGHDEEVQGPHGAPAIAAVIRARYPELEMVLDEGGLVKSDGVGALHRPVALVGTSEKGYLSLELRVRGHGGHSSMPPAHTSAGRVAAAASRLEASPFAPRLSGGVSRLLDYLAPEAPFAQRLVFANQWLLAPLITRSLAATPAGNATIRTSLAVTMLRAGEKDNVLPADASATLNLRLLPGDTVPAVLARVRELVADPLVEIHVLQAREASPLSRTDTPGFEVLHRTIKSVFPDAVVAPYVVVGATDARAYASLCPQATYRFMPVVLDQAGIDLLHGTDERLSVAAYQDLLRFYVALLRTEW